MTDAAPHFRLDGPLPAGITVLEASAGTGKTYAIAGLAVRYVAVEGVRLPRLLVVTFTRAATAELRERVRRRLVEAAGHLDRVLAGTPGEAGDPLLDLLADGDRDELETRRARLRLALAEFDAATIATIHGFCQHMLGGVGLTSDVDRRATLVEDQQELIDAVVDDCYLRAFHAHGAGAPPVTRGALRAIAGKLVGNPEARIVPAAGVPRATDDDGDDAVRWRVRLAHEVRDELDRRKRAVGVLSYDDLLTRLVAALRDERHGPSARARLQQAYDIALIDEFQDTDPIQWEILYRAFAVAGKTLVLIGDPKQAIYAFRGADVYAYLRAGRQAEDRRTLGVNWRSDADLLRACNTLLDRAPLGHPDIVYRDVEAAREHVDPRLVGTGSPPLQLRVVQRGGDFRTYGAKRLLGAPAARAFIARDVAAEAVALLSSQARIVERDGTEALTSRPVVPRDLAVLVRTNAEAVLVQGALRTAGVPAVINGVGSVFATPAASEWLRLLEALERPAAPDRARAAALTPFLGWSAAAVAAADDDAFEPVHDRLHAWAGVLRDRSVAALVRTVWVDERVPERLLGRDDGERLLTDLEHVGELLHAATAAEHLGVTALAAWLRERVAEADQDVPSDERARRLESDAEAVQVLTIHRAKGLQFPVVFCPYLWGAGRIDKDVPLFHDDDERRAIDVGGNGGREDFEEHSDRAAREQQGESLRLLYVAITRACHRVVLWWAPCSYSWDSPLGRVLFCRTQRGVRTNGNPQLPDDDGTLERLGVLVEESGGTIGVDPVPHDREPVTWTVRPPSDDALVAAPFDRPLDHAWRRTSYSALTRPSVDPAVGSEPGEAVVDDEPALRLTAGAAAEAERLQSVRCPLGVLPGGTEFGTFVHGVLERVDFTAADLAGALRDAVAAQRGYRPADVGDVDVLVDGLQQAIETPLGPLAADRALRTVGLRDRRDELSFELPLARGDAPAGLLTVEAIAELLRDRLPADDPLAGYPDRLADPTLQRVLRGYLTGSIDTVLRLPDGRYLVVDYKTNRLAPADEPLTAHHYRPAALTDAMLHGHYPLQALLYAVALHRFLRWRQPGYHPDMHLGGIAYLFVRGMTGPDVPRVDGQPCGVFAWAPPAGLVVALSDLLHSGKAAA